MGVKKKIWTLAELRSWPADRIWFVFSGSVYEATKFKERHPGGPDILELFRGRDVTDQMKAMHPQSALDMLPGFCIGQLADEDQPKQNSTTKLSLAFAKLREELTEEGFFHTSGVWYLMEILRYMVIYALTWFVVVRAPLSGPFLNSLLGGALLGAFWHQIAFTYALTLAV